MTVKSFNRQTSFEAVANVVLENRVSISDLGRPHSTTDNSSSSTNSVLENIVAHFRKTLIRVKLLHRQISYGRTSGLPIRVKFLHNRFEIRSLKKGRIELPLEINFIVPEMFICVRVSALYRFRINVRVSAQYRFRINVLIQAHLLPAKAAFRSKHIIMLCMKCRGLALPGELSPMMGVA